MLPLIPLARAIERLKLRLAQLTEQNLGRFCVQLSEPVDAPPLLAWLASQTQLPKIYWHGRNDGEEIATVGAALDLHFAEPPEPEEFDRLYFTYFGAAQDTQLRLYGGHAFDPLQPAWADFGQARFVLPRIEIRRYGEQAELIVNLLGEGQNWLDEITEANLALDSLCQPQPLPALAPAHIQQRHDSPNQARWTELVTQITDPLFLRHTPKVVMARETQLLTSGRSNHWTILRAWQQLNPNSYQFGFQFSDDHSFISCTPERLFARNGRELSTEALAGTTIRGFTEAEDEALANALLSDHKNSHENLLVRQHIEQQLSPLSDYVGAEMNPSILKLNHIQHLHCSIRAELKAGVTDLQLLGALHPTPAVGGLPREPAMSFIRQREGFDRGWYAGACGYYGAQDSEFAVAIRSARFQHDNVTLYAGAGIVANSKADAEWQELNNKLMTVLGILNGL